MGRKQDSTDIVGNGNGIASTGAGENTVTINGRTYDLPENGTLVVDGNTVSTTGVTDRQQ
jgi:hypothetical protein